jgi:hypothetical protein
MNLIGLDLNYTPKEKEKDKEQQATPDVAPPAPQAVLVIDRDFLLTVALFIVLYGAVITISGMALARVARR